MKNYYSLGYKYATRQPKRSLLILAGVVISIMLMTTVSIATEVYKSALIKQATEQYGAWHVAYETDSFETVELIKQHAMVENVCLILEHSWYRVDDNRKIALMTASKQGMELMGMTISKGCFPNMPYEMVIEDWMADLLNIKSFPANYKMDLVDYTITGTVKTRAEALRRGTSAGLMLYDLDTGLIEKDARHTLLVRFKPQVDILEGVKSLKSFTGLYAEEEVDGVTGPKENHDLISAEGRTGQFTDYELMKRVGFVILGIVLFTLFISIYNIVNISVYDRIRQFGMLRVVGLSPKQLFYMMIQETVIICVIAIPLGVLAGIGLSWLLLLKIGFFQASGMRLVIPIGRLVGGIVFSMATVLISCIIPAIKATRLSPVGAIRNGAGLKVKESKLKAPASSLFLKGRNPLLFPVILSYKNIWRRKKSFILTVITLSLSVFLLITYSFVVKTDRLRAIDRRDVYSSDFRIYISYIDYGKPPNERLDKSVKPPDKGLIESLENVEGVGQVFSPSTWSFEWAEGFFEERTCNDFIPDVLVDPQRVNERYLQHSSDFYLKENGGKKSFSSIFLGYGDKELEIMKEYICEGSIDTELMKNEFIVILPKYDMEISSKDIPYTSLKTGDRVDIKLKDKKITALVGGFFEKLPFGFLGSINEGFMVVMHREKLSEFIENSKCYEIYITVDENADREYVRNQLENIAGEKHGYTVSPDLENNPYEIEMKKLQNQVDTVIYGILACIAVISMLTIVNIISSNIIVRQKEYGMLRATGMTGTELGTMIRSEGLFYGLAGWLTGTFAGLGTSYIIYKFVENNVSTNIVWITPWREILIALAVCIFGSLVSTSLPLSKMRNMSIVENINNIE